jgi:hypothetical protein
MRSERRRLVTVHNIFMPPTAFRSAALILCLATCLAQQTSKAPRADTQGPYDSDHAKWVADSLKEMQTIKPGMTRAQLLQIFTTEGGVSSRTQHHYVYRKCGLMKVEVTFSPVGSPQRLDEDPRDKIKTISKPYLEFYIAD